MDIDSRLIFEKYAVIGESVTDSEIKASKGGVFKVEIAGIPTQFKIVEVGSTLVGGEEKWKIIGTALSDYDTLINYKRDPIIGDKPYLLVYDDKPETSILYINDKGGGTDEDKKDRYNQWKDVVDIIMPSRGDGGGSGPLKDTENKYHDPTFMQKLGNWFKRSPLKVAAYIFKDPETNFDTIRDASKWLQKQADKEATGSEKIDRSPRADIIS